MSATIDLTIADAPVLVRALLRDVHMLHEERARQIERINALELSQAHAWREAGAATATLIEMRSQLEVAEERAMPVADETWPQLRSAIVQMLTRIKGRGDAGHLMADVRRIESLLRGVQS